MCNSSFDAWLYVGGGGGVQYRKCQDLLNDEIFMTLYDIWGETGVLMIFFLNFMFYYISRAATNIDLRAVAAHVLVVNAFLL